MAAGEHASLPRELRWMRRVIDHPVSHAVVYIFCLGVWMLHTSLALGILGRRTGGSEGVRLTDAGKSAGYVGLCTLVFSPVALYLFGLRGAVAAMESDEAPAPNHPSEGREIVWAVFLQLAKDFKLVTLLLFMFGIAGHWVQRSTSGKGCFVEEFGSLVFDISFISIVVIHLLCAQGGSMSGELARRAKKASTISCSPCRTSRRRPFDGVNNFTYLRASTTILISLADLQVVGATRLNAIIRCQLFLALK